MTDKEITRIVLHLSKELNSKIDLASEKLKLSKGSIIRQALEEYLLSNKIIKQ